MTGKECYSFFRQNFLQYMIHSRTPVNVIWMIEYLDGWMDGWMYRRTEYGWVLYLDMLEICNVCIHFLFHWTLSIQRAKGFPTPVWGTSLSTLRLRRLGNEMKSESANTGPRIIFLKMNGPSLYLRQKLYINFKTIHGTFADTWRKTQNVLKHPITSNTAF